MNLYSIAAVGVFGLLAQQEPETSDIQNPLKADGSEGTATAIPDGSELDKDIHNALNELDCIATHENFFGTNVGGLADTSAESILYSLAAGRYWQYEAPEPGPGTDDLIPGDGAMGTLADNRETGANDPEKDNHILIDSAYIDEQNGFLLPPLLPGFTEEHRHIVLGIGLAHEELHSKTGDKPTGSEEGKEDHAAMYEQTAELYQASLSKHQLDGDCDPVCEDLHNVLIQDMKDKAAELRDE